MIYNLSKKLSFFLFFFMLIHGVLYAQEESIPTVNGYGRSINSEELASELTNHLFHVLNIDPYSPIMDIGCGYGKRSFSLARYSVNDVYAIDLSERHIEIIRDDLMLAENSQIKKKIIPMSLDFNNSDEIDKILRSRKFGLILAYNVIHFWQAKDTEAAIEKIYNALAPNGVLFIATENPYIQIPDVNIIMEFTSIGSFYSIPQQAKQMCINSVEPQNCQKDFVNLQRKILYDESIKLIFSAIENSNNLELLKGNFDHPIQDRLPLYPCMTKNKVNGAIRQLFFPQNMKDYMMKFGFQPHNIQVNIEPYSHNLFYVVARK